MRYIYMAVISILVLSSGIPALAQDTNSQKIQQLKDKVSEQKQQIEKIKSDVKQEKEDLKANIETKRQEIQKEREQRIEKRMETQKDRVLHNFDVAIRNLETLKSNISSKITKFQQRGLDMASSTSLLAIADAKIAAAKTEIDTLTKMIPDQTSTSTASTSAQKKAFQTAVKIQSDKAREAIKAAHRALVDVINSMKVGLENNRHSTSTATTTATSTI